MIRRRTLLFSLCIVVMTGCVTTDITPLEKTTFGADGTIVVKSWPDDMEDEMKLAIGGLGNIASILAHEPSKTYVITREYLYGREQEADYYLYLIINDPLSVTRDVTATLSAYLCNFSQKSKRQRFLGSPSMLPFYAPVISPLVLDPTNNLDFLKKHYSVDTARFISSLLGGLSNSDILSEKIAIVGTTFPVLRWRHKMPQLIRDRKLTSEDVTILGLDNYTPSEIANIIVSLRRSIENDPLKSEQLPEMMIALREPSISRKARMIRNIFSKMFVNAAHAKPISGCGLRIS